MVPPNQGRPCTQGNYVSPQECYGLAVTALNSHVSIPIQRPLNQTTIFQILIGMATMQQSIHSISTMLEKSPCETSLRYHLAKLRIDDLEAANTAILTYQISSVLTPGEAYTFAIDDTNDPYYGGVSSENEGSVVR